MLIWCTTNEDEKFRCAIGAVLSKASEEDRQLINDELEGMQGVYGVPSGMPVDLEYMLNSMAKCKIGLQNIWKQAKKPEEPKGGFIQ